MTEQDHYKIAARTKIEVLEKFRLVVIAHQPEMPYTRDEMVGGCEECPLYAQHLPECRAEGPQLLPCELADEAAEVPLLRPNKTDGWLDQLHEPVRKERSPELTPGEERRLMEATNGLGYFNNRSKHGRTQRSGRAKPGSELGRVRHGQRQAQSGSKPDPV
jgi:hypothetical protein